MDRISPYPDLGWICNFYFFAIILNILTGNLKPDNGHIDLLTNSEGGATCLSSEVAGASQSIPTLLARTDGDPRYRQNLAGHPPIFNSEFI